MLNTPEVAVLQDKGHTILPLEVPEGVDLILSARAWRITPELLQYLDLAIKGARGIKYPKGKKT